MGRLNLSCVQVVLEMKQLEIQYTNNNIAITISCGIPSSDFTKKSMDLEEFVKMSDQALHRAKENGRNRVEMM